MRLYHGTTEHIAKLAPKKGLSAVQLTTVHAPFQAFLSASENSGRWGIVEVKVEEKKLRPRNWRNVIESLGVCSVAEISHTSIGRVWVYSPQSNWLITREVLHVFLTPEYHLSHTKKLLQLHRWLTGEFVTIDEWLGAESQHFSRDQIASMRNQLADRTGLDLYYHGS
jgi:hypothetical protein